MKVPEISIDEIKVKFKKLTIHSDESSSRKLTLIIGLDGFLMKTSVFP